MSSEKKTLEVLFHARHMRMRQLVTYSELSNNVDTAGTGSMLLWLVELQSLTAVQRRFRTQYGSQPPTRRSIRFWDNILKTTGSLLHVKSPGETRASEEIAIELERHSS
jgi:hypothetical protein